MFRKAKIFQTCTFKGSGPKRRWRDRDSVFKVMFVAYIAFLFIWGLFEGLVVLGIPFLESYGIVALMVMFLLLLLIPAVAGFYIIHRFFKNQMSSLRTKVFQTCTLKGLDKKTSLC